MAGLTCRSSPSWTRAATEAVQRWFGSTIAIAPPNADSSWSARRSVGRPDVCLPIAVTGRRAGQVTNDRRLVTPASAPDGMDVPAFSAWLTAFGDAWEQRDADATAALFAADATFQPSPFGELVRGRSRLAAHWADVTAEQQAIRFRAEILGVGAIYGIAHLRVVFERRDNRTTRVHDGILLAAFDRRGRATSVRGWSHEAAGPPDL